LHNTTDSFTDPHAVTFFTSADDLAAAVAPFAADGLEQGAPAVLVVRPEHRAPIEAALRTCGVDVDAVRQDGRLVELDAAELLATCSRDGRPDADAFDRAVGDLLRRLDTDAGAVPRIYGEMVGVLWERGDVAAAIELEDLWNDLGGRHPFRLLCGYPSSVDGPGAADVCSRHNAALRSGRVELWRRFDADPTAPRAARRFVAGALRRLDLEGLADTAALVVSELATNVVLHTGSAFTVAVSPTAHGARLSVHDRSTMVPEARDITPESSTGRGLVLVGALAADWGMELAGDGAGKVVWAEVHALPTDTLA
jgi:anti-sigma regulatory factor (Ser/Thr protein kinase)